MCRSDAGCVGRREVDREADRHDLETCTIALEPEGASLSFAFREFPIGTGEFAATAAGAIFAVADKGFRTSRFDDHAACFAAMFIATESPRSGARPVGAVRPIRSVGPIFAVCTRRPSVPLSPSVALC